MLPFFISSRFFPITEVVNRDGNIRYYEYESDSLFALSEHKSSDPQRGMCFLPRRTLEVAECEIARAYKVTASAIEPIAFIVPRKVNTTSVMKIRQFHLKRVVRFLPIRYLPSSPIFRTFLNRRGVLLRQATNFEVS